MAEYLKGPNFTEFYNLSTDLQQLEWLLKWENDLSGAQLANLRENDCTSEEAATHIDYIIYQMIHLLETDKKTFGFYKHILKEYKEELDMIRRNKLEVTHEFS